MKTVFVVDDDPDQAEIMMQALVGPHRRVRAFSDPIRAMGELANQHADVLIADLSMPWINGKEMIACARLWRPGLVIILVSGYARGTEIAQESGIRFFAKPVDLVELRSAVEEALGGESGAA